MTDLGTLGYLFSQAHDINDAGVIVGESRIDNSQTVHGFIYENDAMTDIGTLGGRDSVAFAINSSGQVTGSSDPFGVPGGSTFDHAFIYENGTMTDLGTLGGRRSLGRDINDAGVVVGNSYTTGDLANHAFIWSNDVMLDLNDLIDPLLGWELNVAYAINNLGQIVGEGTFEGNRRGYVLTLANATPGVPEPATWCFLLGGFAILGGAMRQRTRVSFA